MRVGRSIYSRPNGFATVTEPNTAKIKTPVGVNCIVVVVAKNGNFEKNYPREYRIEYVVWARRVSYGTY